MKVVFLIQPDYGLTKNLLSNYKRYKLLTTGTDRRKKERRTGASHCRLIAARNWSSSTSCPKNLNGPIVNTRLSIGIGVNSWIG